MKDAVINSHSFLLLFYCNGNLLLSVFITGVMTNCSKMFHVKCFRKNGMAVNSVIGFVAAALMFFSKMAAAYEMIIVGRLLVGFNCGKLTSLDLTDQLILRVPNQNGVSQALYMVEMYHSGQKPLFLTILYAFS